MVLSFIPVIDQIIALVVGALIFMSAILVTRFYSLIKSGAVVAATRAHR